MSVESYEKAKKLGDFIRLVVQKEMNNSKNYLPLFLPAKIYSVSGNRASVFINGSTLVTPNIPFVAGLTLSPNDEVWVICINFSQIDNLILCKRPI